MQRKFGFIGVLFILAALSIFVVASRVQQTPTTITPQPTQAMTGMGGMTSATTDFSSEDLVPLVRGIFEGEEVFFIHTEASDRDVSNLLTDMMGPDVITVPNLAEIPDELLGKVYVFTNGVAGGGPMGFQADVFDSVPGNDDYTPLRMLNLVTWQEGSTPQQLNDASEIEAAQDEGKVIIEQPDVVINMPILIWPDGQR